MMPPPPGLPAIPQVSYILCVAARRALLPPECPGRRAVASGPFRDERPALGSYRTRKRKILSCDAVLLHGVVSEEIEANADLPFADPNRLPNPGGIRPRRGADERRLQGA